MTKYKILRHYRVGRRDEFVCWSDQAHAEQMRATVDRPKQGIVGVIQPVVVRNIAELDAA